MNNEINHGSATPTILTKTDVSGCNLINLLKDSLQQFPTNTALQLEEQGVLDKFTYQELWQAVEKTAQQLQALGIKPGLRIVLLSENRPEWIVAYLAVLTCRASVVVLDTNLEIEDYHHLLENAEPAAVLVTDKLQQKMNFVTNIPVLAIQHDYALLNATYAITLMPDADSDAEIATILYTSGTTGRFKGVLITHENLVTAIQSARALTCVNDQDSILCILPGYHVFGLVCAVLTPLAVGAKITFVEKMQGEVILQAMRFSQCTILPAVPRLLELFAAGIDRQVAAKSKLVQVIFNTLYTTARLGKMWFHYNLGERVFKTIHESFGGHLKLIVSGGASLDKTIFHQLETLGFNIIEGYGLTETTSLTTANQLDKRRAGTVGVPVPGVKVELFNTNAHGEGEIIVQSKTVMRGYFRDQQATEMAIRDHWLHTGDLGQFDSHGYLFITGRIKELIVKHNGEKAMPADIEQRYRQIPGVAELAVIGMPAKTGYGEEIHAAIVLTGKDNLAQRQDDVKHFIMERSSEVPASLRIQECHFVDELPKTSTLKVKRKILVQQLLSKQGKKDTNPSNTPIDANDKIAQEVTAVIRSIMEMTATKSINTIKPEFSIQFDLGLDSLSRLELAEAIQKKFAIHFEEQQLAILYTVGDLVQAVKRALENGGSVTTPINPTLLQPGLKSAVAQPLPFEKPKPRSLVNRRIQRITFNIVRRLLRSYFSLQTYGQENLPKDRPFIIAANHTSHLDSACLATADGIDSENLVFMAAKDYHFGKPTLRSKILKYFLNLVPFERNLETVGILQNIEICRYYAQEGDSLVIFPEGTRSVNGKLQNFKAAVPIIAVELGIPIVPVYIAGAYACLPKGKIFPKRGKITITFGAPLYIEQYRTSAMALPQQQHQVYKAILQDLRQHIDSLAK